ncbi:tubby-related 4 [Pelobates cultripes]|uniref:Tubby-related 4 n=1 Tax=Pelobates cultripes TaxID=61616 RepID=A0AAD1VU46_PELCU|nr:tubby-related 4 [Pelobates cultripes]
MDCHGRMLAHVLLHESDGILSMSWNYPSFLVEDSSESDTDSDDYSPPQDGPAAYSIPMENIKPLLTVGFSSGDISLMNNYDDLSPTIIRSGLKDTHLFYKWNKLNLDNLYVVTHKWKRWWPRGKVSSNMRMFYKPQKHQNGDKCHSNQDRIHAA